ncbi:D-aminoacyl-tRNA deacylase [Halorarum halobium]|uniref:D-aminoacyl-tRNA deacylase n=1 Tax=Halorarum halobium TaxID=3075121 RepID=UPI0028A77C10|nr:D-aminoacyl-tRNA deacylase [Halobaculum sp. XH14]
MIAVVVSRADRASEHVGERLLALADWTEHEDDARPDANGGGTYHRTTVAGTGIERRAFDDLHIYLDDPVPAFSERPEFLVFVSRHSGDTGPLLTCHFTGNFGAAEYGGADGSFAPACPGVQRALVEGFHEHAPGGYDVAIECTHHGPTDVSVPSLFAELGSDEAEWDDPDGAAAVARAVLDLPERDATESVGDPDDPRHLVGFGGGHYAPRFTRVVEGTEWGVGHVASDWQLDELGPPQERRDVLADAFAASGARFTMLDGEHPALERALAALAESSDGPDVRVVSETWVREVGDRPLDLVASLEADLRSVDEGLRFGASRATEYEVREFPADLLAEAQGVDAGATRAAVTERTVAFETNENGTRAAGSAAFPSPATGDATAARDGLIGDLASVLGEKYDEVTRTDGAVVARVAAFDPAAAAELGVPEGPKFGRLAGGSAVEVDGETVGPGDVTREREERFPV